MIKYIGVTDREVENGYRTLCTSKLTRAPTFETELHALYCGTKSPFAESYPQRMHRANFPASLGLHRFERGLTGLVVAPDDQ
jgi:hypothetical protein